MKAEDLPNLPPREDRRAGAILGLAAGDALGASYEFRMSDEIPEGPLKIVGGGWLDLAPGETTDDTALAKAVLMGYVGGSLDLRRVRNEMLRWEESDPPDIGNQTSMAFGHLRSHREALSLPEQPHAQGNGSVMRAASHGVMARSLEEAVDNAWTEASLTHPSQISRASSALIAGAAARLIEGATPNEAVEAAFSTIEGGINQVKNLRGIFQPYEIKDVLDAYPGDEARWGWTVYTTRLGLDALLNAGDFRSGVESVVRLGGDADTNGAVSGALLGARFGAASIPTEWVNILRGKEDLLELI